MENPSPLTEIFIDVDALIKFVESRPILWQPTESAANSKKIREERNEAWLELCKTMYRGPDFDLLLQGQKDEFVKEVKNKWNNIKNAFQKSRRRRSESATDESSKTSRGKYANDNRLEFLTTLVNSPREHECALETTSDVDLSTHMANLSVETEPDEIFAGADPPVTSNRNESASSNVTSVFSNTSFNRHLLFFHSILPSLDEFTDDETIRFQNAVSQAILDIKNVKRARPPESNSRQSYLIHQLLSSQDSTPASASVYQGSIFSPNESTLSTVETVGVKKSSKGQPLKVSSPNESDSTIED